MAQFVLDASVAISWCFPGDPNEDTPYSRSILRALLIQDAIVPEIWAFEIANNIYVSCNRRKRINEQQVSEYLRLLGVLPIQVEQKPMWSNIQLEFNARSWNIAAYDASYLALAIEKNIPIATTDSLLRQKATAVGAKIMV